MPEHTLGCADIAQHTLTLTLLEGEHSAACPSHFTARDRVPSIQWTQSWMGHRAGLDVLEKKKKKNPLPLPRAETCFLGHPGLSILH